MTVTPPLAPGAPRAQMRWPLWVLIGFDLIVVGLAAWTLTNSRRQYVERAEATTHNLALVLEQNLMANVRQIDLVLQSVKDEVERVDLPAGPAGAEAHLRAQVARVALLDSLRTTDAQGRMEQSVGPDPGPHRDFSGLPFFQHLRRSPQDALFISRPAKAGTGGTWVITLARRMERPKGVFQGVVLATVRLDQLTRELAQVDVGQHGSISLRGADLELLARYPSYPGDHLAIGDNRIQGDYLVAVQSGRQAGRFTTHSVIDGQTRTYSFRRLSNPTFFILVGLAQEEYLLAWRREALLSGAAVVGLLALSFGIGWMARSAWRRQQNVQALIESQESKFRLLAENALDAIWTADPDGRITYVSPAVTSQRGFTPEELLGAPLFDRQLPEQDPRPIQSLLERARRAAPGSQPFKGERIELDLLRKDGQAFRAEIRVRLLWDENQKLTGLQGVTRDITERDRLIQELTQALLEVKNLKGMLPICGHCKKIRDDGGYWNSLESYISEHTEATFTHGVCPDCAQELRREIQAQREQRDQD